jgi:hypothetical protein
MGDRADAITHLRMQLQEIETDLEAARQSNGWSAVASMHNAMRQVRKQLIELLPEDQDDPVEEMSAEEVAEAIAAGILELPDKCLDVVDAALAERRRNGLRLVQ